MTCCMTGTHGALRPMNIAMTSGSCVDRAVVLREKHRPTTVAFFVTTGPLTDTSSALRAFLGRSSPSVATALPISAPPAAAESIPAPTEPRPATRAKQVALRRRKEARCVRRAERGTTAQKRVLQSVRSVPLGSTAWHMPALARSVILVTPQQQAQLRVRRALQVASVAQSVQIRACLVSQVVTLPMPAARGAHGLRHRPIRRCLGHVQVPPLL